MSRVVMILVMVVGTLSVGSAHAQPEPVDLQPAPPQPQPYPPQPQPQPYPPQPQPPPTYYVAPGTGCPPGLTPTRRGCVNLSVEADPAYQAARSRRTTGIVVAAVLPSIGVVTIAVASFVALARSADCNYYYGSSYTTCSKSYTSEKIAIGVGAAMVVVGLAVGIPVAVSASRQMQMIRAMYSMPRASLDVGPDRAVLVTSWAF
jgi:hypothetical protein